MTNANKRLLDGMVYTPAASTDIRKLFKRVRKEIEATKSDERARVTPIRKERKA